MKIIFAAGGTAGHINPALAVANRMKSQYGDEIQILFVGTANGMEAKLVPDAGYDFQTIDISGFYRSVKPKFAVENVKTVFRMVKSSFTSRKIISNFKPDVVVGFGGYVSGPVLRSAHKMGIPIALHEQNAFPGITNKALAKFADVVMLTSKDAEARMQSKNLPIVTGLPVRDELVSYDRDIARAELGIPDGMPLVLSMGGSLGATAINKAVCGLLLNKKDDSDCYFIHATGQQGNWVTKELKEKGLDVSKHSNIEIREYINDMYRCMPAADLLICRAGASSLYEIRALGKASILIPSPNVAENHQYYNAMELVNNGAALIVEEKDLTADLLTRKLNSLLENPNEIHKMERNAKSMAIMDATDLIVQNIMKLVSQK